VSVSLADKRLSKASWV